MFKIIATAIASIAIAGSSIATGINAPTAGEECPSFRGNGGCSYSGHSITPNDAGLLIKPAEGRLCDIFPKWPRCR